MFKCKQVTDDSKFSLFKSLVKYCEIIFRLKSVQEWIKFYGYGCPKPNPPRITIESACWIYITSSIYFHISTTFKKICISLSYAFCSSAWWNWQKAFLFPNGVKVYYLSLLKSSSFYLGERWYNRYSTWMAVYQHIS